MLSKAPTASIQRHFRNLITLYSGFLYLCGLQTPILLLCRKSFKGKTILPPWQTLNCLEMCPSFIYVAVIKYPVENQFRRKRGLIAAYISRLQSTIMGEPRQGSTSNSQSYDIQHQEQRENYYMHAYLIVHLCSFHSPLTQFRTPRLWNYDVHIELGLLH